MGNYPQYQASMEEIHHIHKLDQPSGTAITLAEDLIKNNPNYRQWVNNPTDQNGQLGIDSIRKGEVPGTHAVTYTSEVDLLSIQHEAKDRAAFALGAVLVAEWIPGKTGMLSMDDFLTI